MTFKNCPNCGGESYTVSKYSVCLKCGLIDPYVPDYEYCGDRHQLDLVRVLVSKIKRVRLDAIKEYTSAGAHPSTMKDVANELVDVAERLTALAKELIEDD